MKGRGAEKAKKVDHDIGEPPGAFVGYEAGENIGGTPPTKSRGPKRVSGDTFHATGESQATSIKAARVPTHWRRGGFVSAKRADGGEVKPLPITPKGPTFRPYRGPLQGTRIPLTPENIDRVYGPKDEGKWRGGFVSHKTSQKHESTRHEGSDVEHGPPPDADRDAETNYKRGGSSGKWMQGAVKHPGALHRSLGVPQGQKIPAAKIAKAAHSSNPTLRRRAILAQTFAKHRP